MNVVSVGNVSMFTNEITVRHMNNSDKIIIFKKDGSKIEITNEMMEQWMK